MKHLIVIASLLVGSTALAKGNRPPAAPPISGVANLNTATLEQLELLPGVGPSRAKAILAYRSQKPFAKTEDVRKVKGVGKGVFKKMGSHVAVSGPNTIAKLKSAKPASEISSTM